MLRGPGFKTQQFQPKIKITCKDPKLEAQKMLSLHVRRSVREKYKLCDDPPPNSLSFWEKGNSTIR